MLTEVAKIGLSALAAIEAGKPLDAKSAASMSSRLEAAAKHPVAEVRIGVVAPVEALVNMASK